MSSKRFMITAITLATALSLPLAAQEKKQAEATAETSEKAPRLTLVEPLKDFGTVPKGAKLDWSFVIKNSGEADLQVLSAQPSCGCTVADYDKVIKPGQSGKISTVVDTTSFSGPISKTVTIQTNDPNTPAAQLTVHAIVKPYVEASPAGFVRYSLLHGDTGVQSIKLYSEEEEPFEIKNIEVPGEYVKVDVKKLVNPAERLEAGRPGQNQYQLDVTFGGPSAKVGPLAEKIIVHTNSKHQPEYQISLTGLVRPRFLLNPTIVNFGEVKAGDAAATRTVLVSTNDKVAPAEFKVTKVESLVPGVTAETKALDIPGNYEVVLAVSKNAKAGELDGKVKIHTTDKVNPIVEVPVKALIKKS